MSASVEKIRREEAEIRREAEKWRIDALARVIAAEEEWTKLALEDTCSDFLTRSTQGMGAGICVVVDGDDIKVATFYAREIDDDFPPRLGVSHTEGRVDVAAVCIDKREWKVLCACAKAMGWEV